MLEKPKNRLNKEDIYKYSLLFLLVIIAILPFSSANLGTWKQGQCVNIRVLSNCSSVKLSEVTIGTNVTIINTNMQNLAGQTFNYSFCNTSTIGTYTYSWSPSCVDCSQGDCGNSFDITESGTKVSLSNIIIVIVFLFVGGLCFFLGNTFNNDKWIMKSFFYLCALLLGILAVNSARIIASESQDLFKMASVGFILILTITLAMFLYTFIYWLTTTFKQMKDKREIRWKY